MANLSEFDSKAFNAGLDRALKSIGTQLPAVLDTVGRKVVNATKLRAPVDTGRLRASYVWSPGRDTLGPFVEIGTPVKYAPDQEFGTKYQSGTPHFRPGLLTAVQAWQSAAANIKPQL